MADKKVGNATRKLGQVAKFRRELRFIKLGIILLVVASPFFIYLFDINNQQAQGSFYDIVLESPRVQDETSNEITQLQSGQDAFFLSSITNSLESNQIITAIFDVRNSKDITVALNLHNDTISKFSTLEIKSIWKAEDQGEYTIRVFLISGYQDPLILSGVKITNFTVFTVSNTTLPPAEEGSTNQEQAISIPSSDNHFESLRKYALERINNDRNGGHSCDPFTHECSTAILPRNLLTVLISENNAAQVHAQDVLESRQISHWMTNGEKPYMTYTRYGGHGYVAQNVAISGYSEESIHDCNNGKALCIPIDPYKEIARAEYNMMFHDEESDWGHRDNIIDKDHTHVSIGIAYNQYYFVLVQNFENNYMTLERPLTSDNIHIEIYGKINNGDLIQFDVYYDDLPTSQVYEKNKLNTSYGPGEFKAIVVKPAGFGYYYEQPSEYALIEATRWSVNESRNEIDIRFDISSIQNKKGVYTLMAWLEDPLKNKFIGLSYSIFVI